ncbi:MAG: sulfurtransferase-like selenium metabolism protein YedF [Anaerolineae bacterium]
MPVTVDARGLPCPQPVILTRNAMRQSDQVTTLVSAADQVDNVRRLAERAGWEVSVATIEDGLAVHMSKGHTAREPEITPDLAICAPGSGTGRVLVLASDQIGRGEPELGKLLVRSFLHTLLEVSPRPDTLILMNAGVKLAIEGSPVLADLLVLQEDGLQILACGTCLDYYQVKSRIAVGIISNMYTIAETILSAEQSTFL